MLKRITHYLPYRQCQNHLKTSRWPNQIHLYPKKLRIFWGNGKEFGLSAYGRVLFPGKYAELNL